MIFSLRGKLLEKKPSGIVIECAGVGYGLSLSMNSFDKLGHVNSDVFLWVYTHVGQDYIKLFGFFNIEERETFEILIGINSVGPKLALTVLSTFHPNKLSHIVHQKDISFLVRIPGVGKKTAERLIIELKDKLPKENFIDNSISNNLLQDFVSALENLGFKEDIAQKTAKKINTEHPQEENIGTLVRLALKNASQSK